MAKGFRVTIKSLNPEVTGSSYIFNVKRPGEPYEQFLVDFGGFQECLYYNLNYLIDFEPSELSYVIATHSHLDHVGRLPMLVNCGFHREIYCTPACKKSISICLKDSLKIMQFEHDKFGKEMLFTKKELDETESLLTGIEYNLPTHVSKGVKVTFLGNGHLYGSASILLEISCPKYESKNILITSDYYPSNELYKVKEIPEWVLKLQNLSIIQESTYGATHTNEVKKVLDGYIMDALNIGNNILFPVISQERLELVLLKLKQLQDNNLLSTAIKIFVHTELGKQYLENVYLKSKDIIDFMPKNVELIDKGDFETALMHTGQKIILSSSGMADRGCVRFYLKNFLPRKNFTVIFTCYTSRETLGYKLRNSVKGTFIHIDDAYVPLYCDIKHTSQLSKHAKFEDIVEYIQQFKHVKNVFLTHGETKVKNILYENLSQVFPDINLYIMNRETGFKIDSNIDVTTSPTNFEMEFSYNSKQYNNKNSSKKSARNKKKKPATIKRQSYRR